MEMVLGGISAVAPLWAGLIALNNQQNGKSAGFIHPQIYAAKAVSAFNDIPKSFCAIQPQRGAKSLSRIRTAVCFGNCLYGDGYQLWASGKPTPQRERTRPIEAVRLIQNPPSFQYGRR
jgi:hypothetical protein